MSCRTFLHGLTVHWQWWKICSVTHRADRKVPSYFITMPSTCLRSISLTCLLGGFSSRFSKCYHGACLWVRLWTSCARETGPTNTAVTAQPVSVGPTGTKSHLRLSIHESGIYTCSRHFICIVFRIKLSKERWYRKILYQTFIKCFMSIIPQQFGKNIFFVSFFFSIYMYSWTGPN